MQVVSQRKWNEDRSDSTSESDPLPAIDDEDETHQIPHGFGSQEHGYGTQDVARRALVSLIASVLIAVPAGETKMRPGTGESVAATGDYAICRFSQRGTRTDPGV